MIYDCFMFFNENDLLEVRIKELYEIVDKFVIVEGAKTCSGESKKPVFDKKRFKEYEDKIIYCFLEDFEDCSGSWDYENFQRNHILKILKEQNCNPDDIIIISDLDEIPSPSAIQEFSKNPEGIASLEQKFYYYFLNLLNQTESPWHKAKILTYKEFFKEENNVDSYYFGLIEKYNQGVSPTKVRMCLGNRVLNNGGWHFSYLGGVEKIIEKLKNFSHQEFNTPYFLDKDRLLNCLRTGVDLFDRGNTFSIQNIDETYPKTIYNNKEKYSKFIIESFE